MNTWACCDHCRLPTHLRERTGSRWRDDHAWPCAKCVPGESGRKQVPDPELPILGRAGLSA